MPNWAVPQPVPRTAMHRSPQHRVTPSETVSYFSYFSLLMLILSILYMTITNAIDSTAAAAAGSLSYISLDVCSVWFVPPVSKFFSDIEPVCQMHSRNAWNAYRMRVSAQENCYIYCIAFSGRTQQESSRGGIEKSSNRRRTCLTDRIHSGIIFTRRHGGTGRRRGLKIPRP